MVMKEPAAGPLRAMFDRITSRYDLINRLFTLGLDGRWRARAAAECLRGGAKLVLDLGAGTGDLAFRLSGAPGATVIAADFSAPMLSMALARAARGGMRVRFVMADAAALPFRDGAFDAVGAAFSFRNLTHRNPGRERHLAEILRVIAPGGRLVIVESSQPRSRLLRMAAHCYIRSAVSLAGGLMSGERGAYRYLASSAVNFFSPGELSALLLDAGFGRVEHRPLLGGVAAIHVAHK